MKTIIIDLDDTLCYRDNPSDDYFTSKPFTKRIEKVNRLYDQGNIIKIYTARNMTKDSADIHLIYHNMYERVKKQLDDFGLKYHQLMLGKPSYDIWVDDKAINDKSFFSHVEKRGIVIGSFSVLHPGYVKMFNEIREHCDFLEVALHEAPSIERVEKLPPILSIEDRCDMLYSLRQVDSVIRYKTEKDLYEILKRGNYDIRFMGDDYVDKYYTGKDLNIPVHFIKREHGWSATKYKEIIHAQIEHRNKIQDMIMDREIEKLREY